jgi:hypothetical protein
MAIRAAPARARRLGAGCVRFTVRVVWVRRGPVTRPSELRHAVSGDRPMGTAATHAGARRQQITRHRATAAVSVTDTRHTQYTFSTHGTAVFYVPHVKHSAVTWFTRRVRLAKAGPHWPRPRDGRKRAQTRLPAPSRTDVTDVNGCYRMVYDVVCTGAVLLFAGVVSLHRVAISSAISLQCIEKCHRFQCTDL